MNGLEAVPAQPESVVTRVVAFNLYKVGGAWRKVYSAFYSAEELSRLA